MGTQSNLFATLLLFFAALNASIIIRAEEAAAANEAAVDAPAQPLSPAMAVNGEETAMTVVPPEKETPEYLKYCYYTQPEVCLSWNTAGNETNQNVGATPKADTNGCQCRPDALLANSWYCCNITAMSQISSCSNVSNWNNLHIHNATITVLDLSNSIYQTLHSLAITGGNITLLNGSFSRVSSIKCLNISNNNILDISNRSLKSAPHMKFLDISNNNLTRMPTLNQNQNLTINMGGNKHMLCANLIDTITRDLITFLNPNVSYCLMNLTHNWFNSTDSISIDELEMAARIQIDCPVIPGFGNCTCKADRTLIIDNKTKKQIMPCNVDCSNLGLTDWPPKLPASTFFLNISNNNITTIGKHFQNNPTYWNIFQLDADNNQISDILNLEATQFLEKFNIFYLRNNALPKLPVYLLTNSLSNNYLGRHIYLGGNKLQCDCNSAKVLKYWLLEHERDIPDQANILCRNMPQRVMELQETKVCQSPQDWTDYIYYLIATEVFLLLALITKVSYDYYIFKTAVRLPWPANKMPKLPCDWLCE